MKKMFIVLGAIIVFLIAASIGALTAACTAYNSRAPTAHQKASQATKASDTKPTASSKAEAVIQNQIIQKQVIQALPDAKGAEVSVTTSGTAGNAVIQIHSSSIEKAQYIADLLRRIYPTCTITIIL